MPLSPSDTILVAAPVDFAEATKKYVAFRNPRTPYSDAEVAYVVNLYRDACKTGGVDIELALSQMVHETAALTSDWSQPPKRNPAGIGVTGGLDPATGQPLGQWFDTWTDAVQSHVGLLLCYRFATNAEGSAGQQRLIRVYTSFRSSPPRGVASTVEEMAVKWAADPDYTKKLVAMSAAISKAA